MSEPDPRLLGSDRPVSGVPPSHDARALLEVDHLQVHFPVRSGLVVARTVGRVHAVDDVSFALQEGETLGIVGSRVRRGRSMRVIAPSRPHVYGCCGS